jgi:acetyl-CoA carboxylase alpha subunit
LKNVLLDELENLSSIDKNDFLQNRIDKYDKLGFFEDKS